jgi:hypothetical protein
MLENDVMPKLLVLYDGRCDGGEHDTESGVEQPSASLAENVAAAAKAVRFTEVDVRAVAADGSTTGTRHKVLESPEAANRYDGVVLVGADAGSQSAIESLLDAWRLTAPSTFANTVFGAIGFENPLVYERVARLGGIIVGEPRDGTHGTAARQARAEALGRRVAKVAEWISHALSHEHGNDHHAH